LEKEGIDTPSSVEEIEADADINGGSEFAYERDLQNYLAKTRA
jgi:hypothetical protein